MKKDQLKPGIRVFDKVRGRHVIFESHVTRDDQRAFIRLGYMDEYDIDGLCWVLPEFYNISVLSSVNNLHIPISTRLRDGVAKHDTKK